MPTSSEITGWVFFGLLLCLGAAMMIYGSWLSSQNVKSQTGLLGFGARDNPVLDATAAYALQQMQQGGWKDICDGVNININGVNTHLTNMDMSGVVVSGNYPDNQTEQKWEWLSCKKDPGVNCEYCNCVGPTMWYPFNPWNCDSLSGCGAHCPDIGCCNLSVVPSIVFRIKLGTLKGIDGLMASASNPVATFDAASNSLSITLMITKGQLTMDDVMLGFRLCLATGLVEHDGTGSVTCQVDGPVTLTVPIQKITSCSFTTNFKDSNLDVSQAKVSNVDMTINSTSLSGWLESIIVPLCIPLGLVAVCAIAIPIVVASMQDFMDTQMENNALTQVPKNALGQVADITIPIPCVFCLNPPQPNPITPLSPPAGIISIGKTVANLLENAMLPVVNQELKTVWTGKWPGFPNVNISPDGKAYVALPEAPSITGMTIDGTNSWIDFNTCTVQLAITDVKGEIDKVSLQMITNETVDKISIVASAVAQASATLEYDPAKGGNLTLAINSISVQSANQGSASSSSSNNLTTLVNSLLQYNNGAANVCLASFALSQVLSFPLVVDNIAIPSGLPLLPKVSCDTNLYPNSKFTVMIPGNPPFYVGSDSKGNLTPSITDPSKALNFQFVALSTDNVETEKSVFQLKVGDQFVTSTTISGTGTYFTLSSDPSSNTFSFLPLTGSTAGPVSTTSQYLISHISGQGDRGPWKKGAQNFFWTTNNASSATPLQVVKTGIVL